MTAPSLAVLGLGLIGGAAAAAWRRAGVVGETVGCDPDAEACRVALQRGFVDRIAPSARAAAAADIVLVAAPVGATAGVLREIAPGLAPTTIVTDVGSAKQAVIEAAHRGLPTGFSRFVPAHPIAGAEQSGAAYATADLFDGRLVVTTPVAATSAEALGRVEALWRAAGARIERMDAADHDRIYAAVSHLPHLVAFAVVASIAERPDAQRLLSLAGSGFRDATRIAASSPALWRDIALANRDALGAELARVRATLDRLQAALAAADAGELERVFARASAARRGVAAPPSAPVTGISDGCG